MRQKMKSFFLNKTQSFFGSPRKLRDFYKSIIKTKKSRSSELITNIKASEGRSSQNSSTTILVTSNFQKSSVNWTVNLILISIFVKLNVPIG